LKKADDLSEKQQRWKYEGDGCLLFVQKVDQYDITNLKRNGKWKKFFWEGDDTSLRWE
jgi:hypothetical protein